MEDDYVGLNAEEYQSKESEKNNLAPKKTPPFFIVIFSGVIAIIVCALILVLLSLVGAKTNAAKEYVQYLGYAIMLGVYAYIKKKESK